MKNTIVIKSAKELLKLRDSSGAVKCEGNMRIECNIGLLYGVRVSSINVGGNLDVRGNLDVGGNLYVRGKYLIIKGDLFWAQAHKPEMPNKAYINRVLPPPHQRKHFQERLGFDISDGCYESIIKKALEQIRNLLNVTKWSSTELWMLETLALSTKKPPKWVAEIVSKTDKDKSE